MKNLPVVIKGLVSAYQGNGRKFGYPTANVASNTTLTDGVYFGRVNLAKFSSQPALIFIGTPTTVGDKERRVEAHLLDIPDVDYYGQPIEITIQAFHRPTITFDSVDKLLEAMDSDKASGRQWFNDHPLPSPQ